MKSRPNFRWFWLPISPLNWEGSFFDSVGGSTGVGTFFINARSSLVIFTSKGEKRKTVVCFDLYREMYAFVELVKTTQYVVWFSVPDRKSLVYPAAFRLSQARLTNANYTPITLFNSGTGEIEPSFAMPSEISFSFYSKVTKYPAKFPTVLNFL